jgi:hypothetical protein
MTKINSDEDEENINYDDSIGILNEKVIITENEIQFLFQIYERFLHTCTKSNDDDDTVAVGRRFRSNIQINDYYTANNTGSTISSKKRQYDYDDNYQDVGADATADVCDTTLCGGTTTTNSRNKSDKYDDDDVVVAASTVLKLGDAVRAYRTEPAHGSSGNAGGTSIQSNNSTGTDTGSSNNNNYGTNSTPLLQHGILKKNIGILNITDAPDIAAKYPESWVLLLKEWEENDFERFLWAVKTSWSTLDQNRFSKRIRGIRLLQKLASATSNGLQKMALQLDNERGDKKTLSNHLLELEKDDVTILRRRTKARKTISSLKRLHTAESDKPS